MQRHKLLLIEDNLDHITLIKMSLLRGFKSSINFFCVKDGKEALDFLLNKGDYQDKEKFPRPDIIFLDLKLPKIDGIEVLSVIKSDSELKNIPVIVFTTSSQDRDILKSYELGANSYITKPNGIGAFSVTIQKLWKYWTTTSRLPERL